MNGIVSFRLCKLTNKQLAERVDKLTDNLYKLGPEKVISRHIPARPDEDYDLLIGELVMRFTELFEQLDKSDDIPHIMESHQPVTDEQAVQMCQQD